ncbi:MAG TPA: hypothetical protein VFH51_13520, partial [Myxococcota bacterium]|nr:hypothetical protein [Myxococcota bacterium]
MISPSAETTLARDLGVAIRTNDEAAVSAALAAPGNTPQEATQELLDACLKSPSPLGLRTLADGPLSFWCTAPWERNAMVPELLQAMRDAGVDPLLVARCGSVQHRPVPDPPPPSAPWAARLRWLDSNLPRPPNHVAFVVQRGGVEVPASLKADPRLWQRQFMVTYAGEPASDAGGVTKAWLQEMLRAVCAPGFGLLQGRGNDAAQAWFAPAFAGPLDDARREKVQLLALLLAKAASLGLTTPEVHLAETFLARLAGRDVRPDLAALDAIDTGLATTVRNIVGLSDEALASAEIPFAIPNPSAPGGDWLPLDPARPDAMVTPENKRDYAARAAERALRAFDPAVEAFGRAFYSVLPQALLRPFQGNEVDTLLAGPRRLDLRDWETHTRVSPPTAPYRAANLASPAQIRDWFFEILTEWQTSHPTLPGQLLCQIIHSSRPPAGGFAALTGQQAFELQSLDEPLAPMTASTCLNTLAIPAFACDGGKAELELELRNFATMKRRFNAV